MSIFQEIIGMMKPLGIYSLNGGTLIDAEIDSYVTGLELAEKRLENLLKEGFVQTAEDIGLTMREKLFGSERSSLSAAERRSRLLLRLSSVMSEWNNVGITNTMKSSGFDGTIYEALSDETLLLKGLGSSSKPEDFKQFIDAADEIFPAHLRYSMDLPSPDWDTLDGYDKKFGEWDELGYRWELTET